MSHARSLVDALTYMIKSNCAGHLSFIEIDGLDATRLSIWSNRTQTNKYAIRDGYIRDVLKIPFQNGQGEYRFYIKIEDALNNESVRAVLKFEKDKRSCLHAVIGLYLENVSQHDAALQKLLEGKEIARVGYNEEILRYHSNVYGELTYYGWKSGRSGMGSGFPAFSYRNLLPEVSRRFSSVLDEVSTYEHTYSTYLDISNPSSGFTHVKISTHEAIEKFNNVKKKRENLVDSTLTSLNIFTPLRKIINEYFYEPLITSEQIKYLAELKPNELSGEYSIKLKDLIALLKMRLQPQVGEKETLKVPKAS